ncbi:TetR family transcriptional regulator [Nocardioides alkalitolerans]|uniref:TetR family transcriptional regulator n=1 Tax=Nocardioides alkalitolerans TaxID=281714 RepID=UPI000421FA5E|nr:TetR family transcriptional regulator [Nocardioides alkalitolerans]
MTEAVEAGRLHRENLGATVRALRVARGLTLRGLAAELGVSAATLSGIENGRTGVSSERTTHLAGALGVTVERLLTGGPHQAAPPLPALEPTVRVAVDLSRPGAWRDFPPLDLDVALAAALASFVEFGYHGASMRTIAEHAGLSVPGLYHYYASKHEMLVALLDLTMHDLRARTEAAIAEADGVVERFVHTVESLALFHTHRCPLAFVGASEMRSLSPEARPRVAAMRVEEQRLVDVAVLDGVEAGVFRTALPHEAARAVATMCTALAQWYRAEGPASAEVIARQYVDFALGVVRYEG